MGHAGRVVTDAASQSITRKLTRDVFGGEVCAAAARATSLQLVGRQKFDVGAQPFDAWCNLSLGLTAGRDRDGNDQGDQE